MTTHVELYTWEQSLVKATELVEELQGLNVACAVHADPRGVPCAQLFLTDDATEFAPALMVGTEGMIDVASRRTTQWFGQVQGFDLDMSDPLVMVHERPWLGGGVRHVADSLVPFVHLLRNGAGALAPAS